MDTYKETLMEAQVETVCRNHNWKPLWTPSRKPLMEAQMETLLGNLLGVRPEDCHRQFHNVVKGLDFYDGIRFT